MNRQPPLDLGGNFADEPSVRFTELVTGPDYKITEVHFDAQTSAIRQFSIGLTGVEAGLDVEYLVDSGDYHISNVRVEPEYRGRGYAKLLFRIAREHAQDMPDAKIITALLVNRASQRAAEAVFGKGSIRQESGSEGPLGDDEEPEARLDYVISRGKSLGDVATRHPEL